MVPPCAPSFLRLSRRGRSWAPAGRSPAPPATASCLHFLFGRLAQLGERLPYKQEVAGSSPAPPISPSHRFAARASPASLSLFCSGRAPLGRGLVGGLRSAARARGAFTAR